jgi:hypothetical protein
MNAAPEGAAFINNLFRPVGKESTGERRSGRRIRNNDCGSQIKRRALMNRNAAGAVCLIQADLIDAGGDGCLSNITHTCDR